VEFEFVVEMNLVQIGTNEFFPQLIRLAANERHLQSRPYSNQKLGRHDQSAASSELFLSGSDANSVDAIRLFLKTCNIDLTPSVSQVPYRSTW
jgi:hypothetical protein